jgi:hypothetical protein
MDEFHYLLLKSLTITLPSPIEAWRFFMYNLILLPDCCSIKWRAPAPHSATTSADVLLLELLLLAGPAAAEQGE